MKKEGFDLCLEDILVKGLGFVIYQEIRFNKRKITEGFSSQEKRGFGPGREPTSCVLILCFDRSLMKHTHMH